MQKYNIGDQVFNDGILSGLEGVAMLEGPRALLVGGGAVQFYAEDPCLRRTTIDADLQLDSVAPKSLRTMWGSNTLAQMVGRGYEGEYKHTRCGGEVKVPNTDPETSRKPFYVHLDVFTPKFLNRLGGFMDEVFDRANPMRPEEFDPEGIYLVQAPEDIAAFKLKNVLYHAQQGGLDSSDKMQIERVSLGLIDDVKVGDLGKRLAKIEDLSSKTVEEFARQGFNNCAKLYADYKKQKNLYDILALVQAHRSEPFGEGIFRDPSLIPQTLKLIRGE